LQQLGTSLIVHEPHMSGIVVMNVDVKFEGHSLTQFAPAT